MPSNYERKARKKKQTRLTFDPVDRSSSPANRSPAKVRYELPGTRRMPILSTPNIPNQSDSEDILSTGNTTSGAAASANSKIQPSKARPASAKSPTSKRLGPRSSIDHLADEEDTVTREGPRRTQLFKYTTNPPTPQSKLQRHDPAELSDSSEGASAKEPVQKTRSNKEKAIDRASKVPRFDLTGSGENGKRLKPTAINSQRSTVAVTKRSRGALIPPLVELSSDSSDGALRLPKPQMASTSRDSLGSINKKNRGSENSSIFESSNTKRRGNTMSQEDSDDTEDEIITTSQPRRQRRPIVNLEESESEDPMNTSRRSLIVTPVEDSDDELQNAVSSPLKRRKADSNSEDSDLIYTPLKRRRPNTQDRSSSEDVLPSASKIRQQKAPQGKSPSRYTRQSKTRKHRTEKEKMLELLKRKRAGEQIDALTETESESEEDSDLELQKLSEFEDESETEAVAVPRKRTSKAVNEDGYDSDFVDDDDEGNIGVPTLGLVDIPLEFTHAAHKPLKEHFRDAIEWMVHKKINPAFARDDPVYIQAFRKLDDEYGGYAKSKFVSSQWTADFTRAIYSRPIIIERELAAGEGIDISGEGKCDVCNHRKHFPKFELKFEGKAYHKESLEEVEQDSDDEASDSADNECSSVRSDKFSVNADGQRIPDESKTWFSGRFCKANATQAHALIHWKYALYTWVVGNLEAEGYLEPAKLAEREKMKSKRRREHANSVVDKWAANGHIKGLYRDFKINLESAREAKQTRWSAGVFTGYER